MHLIVTQLGWPPRLQPCQALTRCGPQGQHIRDLSSNQHRPDEHLP